MSKAIRIEMIGNYLEPLSRYFDSKEIKIENIITGVNPLAISGESDPAMTKKYNSLDHRPTAFTLKKNFENTLSHSEENFCDNYIIQPLGREVRYKNTSEYIFVMNNSITYALIYCDGYLYSDTWPQNDFIKEIKGNTKSQIYSFPFGKNFNLQYYYDKFINAILNNYDTEHIILIRTNASRWFIDKDEIKKFPQKSLVYRNYVEKMDDYFIKRTGCRYIDLGYNYIPDSDVEECAFPYSRMSVYSYQKLAESIKKILYSDYEKKERKCWVSTFANTIYNCCNNKLLEENQQILETIENQRIENVNQLNKLSQKNQIFDTIKKLGIFLKSDEKYTLSDYIIDHTEKKDFDFELINLYLRYFKLDINDIVAIYMLSHETEQKEHINEFVDIIINNSDCTPIKTAKKLFSDNLTLLNKYDYISSELDLKNARFECYLHLDKMHCIVLDINSQDNPISLVEVIDKNEPDIDQIIETESCSISDSEKICESFKFYISRAKLGKGNKPIKIKYRNYDEFNRSLSYIDYCDLLNNERYFLSCDNEEITAENYTPITDLSFLFQGNTKICHIRSGFTDQLCYYLLSKRLQEVCEGEVYYDDTVLQKAPSFNGIVELLKVTNEDIRPRLFSNILNKRLIRKFVENNLLIPDILFQCGCTSIMVVTALNDEFKKFTKCNRMIYSNNNDYSDLVNFNIGLMYYLVLIRPEHLMRGTTFSPLSYIKFPPFDTIENKKISDNMQSCDAVAIHVRRGDFVAWGWEADMDFYKESMEKLKNIPDYPNKKFFIFSDDIPWCKKNISEIGFDYFPGADITFVDNNKGENSFRDMQLMTKAKVLIGGNSGFVRMVPLLSERCEIYMIYNQYAAEYLRQAGKQNKYEIGPYKKKYSVNYSIKKPNQSRPIS